MKKSEQQMLETHHRLEINESKLQASLTLNHCVGFTGLDCPEVRLTSNSILFASGSQLVEQSFDSKTQKIIPGHTQTIQALDLSKDLRYIASGQQGPHAQIKIFDRQDYLCVFSWLTEYVSITYLHFSPNGDLLLSVGKNQRNQETILIWDLLQKDKQLRPTLLAKQLSDTSIFCTKFSPYEPHQLVSCGRENIRFLRIKKGYLPATPVILNHYARNSVFTILDFDPSLASKKVYIGSAGGLLFQVNYDSRELEGVFKVHDGALQGLRVSAGFCVTGSEDSFLRVWPLDFSEYFLEAKHEGGVVNVDVSEDGLLVAVGSGNGGLGVMDLSAQSYKTILRSHSKAILDIDHNNTSVVTVSEDGTIRVWSQEGYEQSYEFSYPSEDPCLVVKMHPTENLFVGGFQSGTVRVFDIEKTAIVRESRYHAQPIQQIAFDQSGALLSVVDSSSLYHLLNFEDLSVSASLHQKVDTQHPQFWFSEEYWVTLSDDHTLQFLYPHTLKPMIKVPIQATVYKIVLDKNDRFMVITKENSIKQYQLCMTPDDLSVYMLKEIPCAHQGKVSDALFTEDQHCVVSVGEDRIVKVWDRNYRHKNPLLSLAHVSPIAKVKAISGAIVTAGGPEGLYVWEYQHPAEPWVPSEKRTLVSQLILNKKMTPCVEALHLEEVEEEEEVQEQQKPLPKTFQAKSGVLQQGVRKTFPFTKPSRPMAPKIQMTQSQLQQKLDALSVNPSSLKVELLLGYDQGPFLWGDGYIVYYLENMLIFEDLSPSRKQKILQLPNEISCIAADPCHSSLYIGSNTPTDGHYPVYQLDRSSLSIVSTLTEHSSPVVLMECAGPTGHLITVEENLSLHLYGRDLHLLYTLLLPSLPNRVAIAPHTPLQYMVHNQEYTLLLEEDPTPHDLPVCEFATFMEGGIAIVQKGLMAQYNRDFEQIAETPVAPGVKQWFSQGYQTEDCIVYKGQTYHLQGTAVENVPLQELLVQGTDGWHFIGKCQESIGMRGNVNRNEVLGSWILANGQSLWDLESGVELATLEASEENSFFSLEGKLFRVHQGILARLSEEEFGVFYEYDQFLFNPVLHAASGLIIDQSRLISFSDDRVEELWIWEQKVKAGVVLNASTVGVVLQDGTVQLLSIKDKEIYKQDEFQIWEDNASEALYKEMDHQFSITSSDGTSLSIIVDKLHYLIQRIDQQTKRVPLNSSPLALTACQDTLVVSLSGKMFKIDGNLMIWNKNEEGQTYRPLVNGAIESLASRDNFIICTNKQATITLKLNK